MNGTMKQSRAQKERLEQDVLVYKPVPLHPLCVTGQLLTAQAELQHWSLQDISCLCFKGARAFPPRHSHPHLCLLSLYFIGIRESHTHKYRSLQSVQYSPTIASNYIHAVYLFLTYSFLFLYLKPRHVKIPPTRLNCTQVYSPT